MKKIRIRWYQPIVFVFFVLMGRGVVQLVFASPNNTPQASDIAKSKRVAAPPPGTVDDRQALPPNASVSGNGVIEPRDKQTNVGAGVAGRIAKILVAEGATVHAGDELLELDSGVERAALAAASADAEARVRNSHARFEAVAPRTLRQPSPTPIPPRQGPRCRVASQNDWCRPVPAVARRLTKSIAQTAKPKPTKRRLRRQRPTAKRCSKVRAEKTFN